MPRPDKYPRDSFVYYRDNLGDMIIAKVVGRMARSDLLTVRPGWYAEEPIVLLPLRSMGGFKKPVSIPTSIIERATRHAPE
jgi:hypothetical protein